MASKRWRQRMKSVTKSVRYTTRRLRGWRDILGREQYFVVFVFVFHVKQQFLLLIRQLKPSRNALYKQADAETEQKKGCESRKTLGYDFILRLIYKRGCDHGEGDPRGEEWRSARDAGEWAANHVPIPPAGARVKKHRKTGEKGRFEAVKRAELRFRGKPTVPPRPSPR